MKLMMYPEDKQILRKICTNVENIDDIRQDIKEMAAFLLQNKNAMGLAGPQVGKSLRFFLMKIHNQPLRVCINPRYISTAGLIKSQENCLSIPSQTNSKTELEIKKINRKSKVKIEYTTPDNRQIIEEFTGLEAICVQHEMDHLIGKLILDY